MQLYPVHPEECRACLIWAFEQSETEQDLVRNAAHILAELCIKEISMSMPTFSDGSICQSRPMEFWISVSTT